MQLSSTKKLGFAIKTYDGKADVRNLLLVNLLDKLGVILPEEREFFHETYKLDIYNHRQEIVGKVESLLELVEPK